MPGGRDKAIALRAMARSDLVDSHDMQVIVGLRHPAAGMLPSSETLPGFSCTMRTIPATVSTYRHQRCSSDGDHDNNMIMITRNVIERLTRDPGTKRVISNRYTTTNVVIML